MPADVVDPTDAGFDTRSEAVRLGRVTPRVSGNYVEGLPSSEFIIQFHPS
jgi:hypothetical protein